MAGLNKHYAYSVTARYGGAKGFYTAVPALSRWSGMAWFSDVRSAVRAFEVNYPRLAGAVRPLLDFLLRNADRLDTLRKERAGENGTLVFYRPSPYGRSVVVACIVSRNGFKVVRTSWAFLSRYKHTVQI